MTFIQRTLAGAAAVAISLLLSPPEAGARQQEADRTQRPDSTELAEIRRQLDILTRELETLRLGREVVEADSPVAGFGPAASKVYRVGQGVSVGGYGEVLYENYADEREDDQPSGRTDRLDALRGIIYVGYKFDERFLFNSEIEVEHAATDRGGSVSLEFAYVDYRFSDAVGLRAGLLLSPMGLINELHEPPIFLGTTRPVTENRIIPTTWRENGIGLFGDLGDFTWRAYVLNSFDATGFSGSGLRGGRQKGASALAEDLGVVGRVDYTGVLGLLVGGSAFYGQTGQNRLVGGEEVGGGTLIWEGHADYRTGGLELRALVAGASVGDVVQLNELNGLTGNASIGERMLGWYAHAGYDVLWGRAGQAQLIPYVRYEQVDTQVEVPAGFDRNPANQLRVITLGAAWRPIVNIIFKADYQLHSNEADTGVNQFNIGLGYLF